MTNHKGDFEICRTLFGRNFGFSRTVTTTSASTLTLNQFSTAYQIFQGTTAGQVINLGDATQYFKEGQSFFIVNESDNTLTIEDAGNNTLFEVRPNFSAIAVLEENGTAEGQWRFLLFLDNTLEFVSNSASPGFTWGRRGQVSVGTWLINEDVASNNTGRRVLIDNPVVARVSIDNDRVTTYTLEFFEHDGALTNLISLGTLSVTGARGNTFDLNVPVTQNKQIAVQLQTFTGTRPRNIVVGLVLRGDS
jgi:hypothetical protein